MKNQKGNISIISMFFIAMILIIFGFLMFIFISEVNSILHSVKTQMYSINRNGIIAVNKNIANKGIVNYSPKAYKKYFENSIRENFKLDENFENKNGLIEKVKIKDYEILTIGKTDKYTKNKVKDVVLHTVIEIEIKPIILENIFDKLFVFDIHEDVNLNGVKM